MTAASAASHAAAGLCISVPVHKQMQQQVLPPSTVHSTLFTGAA
jgi:hypothetical protein